MVTDKDTISCILHPLTFFLSLSILLGLFSQAVQNNGKPSFMRKEPSVPTINESCNANYHINYHIMYGGEILRKVIKMFLTLNLLLNGLIVPMEQKPVNDCAPFIEYVQEADFVNADIAEKIFYMKV